MSAVREATVREAEAGDVGAVAVAIETLLEELGGRRPPRPAIEVEVEALVAGDAGGVLLVAADGDGALVGVLAASWGRAIHVPGRYLTIQDLWVDREWRSRGLGAELVAALAERARAEGVARLEVGLPREDFPALPRTESFYRTAGFEHLGPRMRLLLSEDERLETNQPADGPISGHMDTESARRPGGSR